MDKNEFILLKSKDDFSYAHYKNSPLALETGFLGTAGEALKDSCNHITLFVDPRYHIQADIQTKNKNVDVVKMQMGTNFITYLKKFLKEGSTLFVPAKSTSYAFCKTLETSLSGIKIKPYNTEYDPKSLDNPDSPVFEIDIKISGKSAKDKIKKLNSDNFLITDLEQIAYILNLRSYKTNEISTFQSKLFIINPSRAILFTDYKTPDIIETRPLSEFEKYIKSIKNEIKVDYNSISLYDYNLIQKPVPVKKNPIVKMASVKNKYELNHYIESFKRLDIALYNFEKRIKEGLSEFELNKIFYEELLKAGACTTSFKTILAIGENSSIIHYTSYSNTKVLKKGDIILLDCGGYFEGGYATDITRVFCYGDVNEEVKEIYTAVLKAQLKVYHSNLLYTDELYDLAVKTLKKYEKKGFFFPHGLGHGIGIPVHQPPLALTKNVRQKLRRGNVFSIEPGLYCEKKFGIRLENSVYFKDGKKISLSHFPYNEKMINFDMLNKTEKKLLADWNNEAKRIYE